jgi:hypothetical protein
MAVLSDDEDEDDIRPAKRRKTDAPEDSMAASRSDGESGSRRPFDQVTIEKRRVPQLPGKIHAVQPSDFYGKSQSVHSKAELSKREDSILNCLNTSIDDLLPKTPACFKKALRLDITSIVQIPPTEGESTVFVKDRRRPVDIECRCSVALFFANNDDDPDAPIVQADYVELIRKLSTCILRTTINEEGEVVRKFINLEPFVFTADEIYINRKNRNGRKESTHLSFDFAPRYFFQIILDRVGHQKEWLPFDMASLTNPVTGSENGTYPDSNPVTDLLNNSSVTKNELYLYCRTATVLLDPSRQSRAADLKLSYRSLRQSIPYAFELDIKWSLPSHISDWYTRSIKMESKSPRAKIASAAAVAEAFSASPLARKDEIIFAPNSPPDRAQRRRSNVPTYNLKALSALQQGKSPRIHRSREVISRSAQGGSENSDGTFVTYTFGEADSSELSVKRETTIVGLRCALCGYSYSALDELRVHLHTNHSCFKFSLLQSNSQRIGFTVEVANRLRRNQEPLLEQARTFQLSQPRSLFDLEKFLNGDDSWVKARQGPQHNIRPEHLQHRFHESSLSSSPHESRHSSPNTSNDTDDVVELENDLSKLMVKRRKKYYVPKTSKPLFDIITKQVLEPGAEIPSSDDEKDEGWLHHKHRDIIMDYEDVTDDEKDYIIRWNPFIMAEQLTWETHLPDAVIRFVEANKSWFTQRKSRKKEFAKIMETFMMRGIVDEKCMGKCIEILKEAEKMERTKENEATEAETSISPAKQRGALDCECGEHTQSPDRVICHGQVSFSMSKGSRLC